ncbi:hypothetical protein BGM26_10445 [Bacillus sp. FJAT-29790]|uniref:hypothetical protein n=1 Tax=Bacillus sp. FJAT-29790 TaxID=1895002 RepID=UPI001C23A0B7|nr:hypothetical protein [Bacillus sp. FJAT-29790]MBU8879403.1 hypothetical protein [Bacillus sp. FJAT-29790]
MKRLALFLITVLLIYVIYFDLNHGTLPVVKDQVIEAKSSIETSLPFFEKEVRPGETVLSVVERKLDGPLPVSISDVVTDFKILNNGLKPEELKSGQTYRFPDYGTND